MIEYLSEIQEHLESEYPREGCGVLAVVKGRSRWFPCTNVAKGNDSFIIDSTEYLKISRSADIVGIVHSHPDASNEPSEHDIATCNALGITYYIFSLPDMELFILEPVRETHPLMGREYAFGVFDCFEAVRDYYIQERGLDIPSRKAYEDDWWLKGLDYFTPEYIKTWGFEPVDRPEKGDLLVFSHKADVGNHCGVYLGEEIFYHHAVHRLSCRDHLQPMWRKSLTGIYRYVA